MLHKRNVQFDKAAASAILMYVHLVLFPRLLCMLSHRFSAVEHPPCSLIIRCSCSTFKFDDSAIVACRDYSDGNSFSFYEQKLFKLDLNQISTCCLFTLALLEAFTKSDQQMQCNIIYLIVPIGTCGLFKLQSNFSQ